MSTIKPNNSGGKMPHTTKCIIQMSAPYIRGKVLDLGAGTAKYKNEILKHANSYVACDIVDGKNIDIVTDVHNLSFNKCSFDTIICTQVMEHVERPWEMVESIARVLNHGGYCIITTPFLMPYHADPHDYFRCTLEGGRSLFEKAGLSIVRAEKYGGIGVVIAEACKFLFCSPYKHPKPGFFRRNIFRLVHKTLYIISDHPKSHSNIYANIYLVAKKP